MSGIRSVPSDSTEAIRRLTAVWRRMPAQQTDPGASEQLASEMHELARARGRATGAMLSAGEKVE